MQTNRQVISDVMVELKKLNLDDRVSKRFILSRLKDKAKYYIKQDLDSRKLLKLTTLWKRIKCLNMRKVDFMECGLDVPHCKCLMKSCEKLPKFYESNYGGLVKVFTINGDKEYKQTTIGGYKEIQRREIKDNSIKYFWIEDQYVFIPDSEVESVTVQLIAENPEEVDKMNCDTQKKSECASPLDAEFVCPDYILKIVKEEFIIELAKLEGIVEDEKGDLDTNSKK